MYKMHSKFLRKPKKKTFEEKPEKKRQTPMTVFSGSDSKFFLSKFLFLRNRF